LGDLANQSVRVALRRDGGPPANVGLFGQDGGLRRTWGSSGTGGFWRDGDWTADAIKERKTVPAYGKARQSGRRPAG
jgi:hypothetical protein